MRTIYKQELLIQDIQSVELPIGAKILHLGVQHNSVFIWYECEAEDSKDFAEFYCYGTGHVIPADRKQEYIGTVILRDGNLVLHFYKEDNK